jgi:hypothetical protein
MKTRLNLFAVLALLALSLSATKAAAQPTCQVKASVSPQNAVVGDTVVYIVQVDCVGAEETPQVQPPDILPDSGLTEMRQAGTRTQISIVNGRTTKSFEYRFALQALKPGEYQIPPATVAVDGRIFESNVATLRVTKSPEAPTEAIPSELRGLVAPPRVPDAPQLEKALTGKIFILAVPETTQPLSGQQFLLSYHLFIDQDGLAQAGIDARHFTGAEPQLPQLKEFMKEDLFGPPQNLRFEQQVVGGRRYAVAPLYQVALTPTRSGHVAIEPLQIGLMFPVRGKTRRVPSGDPFFDLFDFDPFESRGLQIVVRSTPVELDVAPLPEAQRPTDFCGAVGQFTLEASVDKTHLVANEDVARLRVTLRGEGNAGVATPPPFPQVDGLVLLEEPKSNSERKIENNKLVTIKTFDYLFRAIRPGSLRIPPIQVAVFNPVTRRYERLATREILLTVAPGMNAPVLTALTTTQPVATAAAQPEVRKDLRYIHERVSHWTTVEQIRTTRQMQVGLVSFGAGIFLIALVVAEIRQRRGDSYLLQQRQRARSRLLGLIRKFEAAAGDVAPEDLGELGSAIREYLSFVLRVDQNALTNELICTKLAELGVADEVIRATHDALELGDTARYAPAAVAAHSLHGTVGKLRKLVEEVEKCGE